MNQLVRGITALTLAAATPLFADFSYKRTTQITGGSIVKMSRMMPGASKALQPTTTTVAIHGNKMADWGDREVNIIDLDAQTMTSVDLEHKTYSVITFEEFRQALDSLSKTMSQNNASAPSIDVSVKETGQQRSFAGYNAKEFLVALTMGTTVQGDHNQSASVSTNMDMNMWMAPTVAGYEEVQSFYKRMAEKMAFFGGMSMNPMMMGRPGFGQAMVKMQQEMSKLQGVPVHEVLTMRGMGMGMPGMPAMSGNAPSQDNGGNGQFEQAVSDSARNTAANEAAYQAARASGGRLGGLAGVTAGGMLGGFGRKKKQAEPPKQETATAAPAAATPAAQPAASVLMESTTDYADFSGSAVDPSKFAVPAGFKQVDHPMKKMAKN